MNSAQLMICKKNFIIAFSRAKFWIEESKTENVCVYIVSERTLNSGLIPK